MSKAVKAEPSKMDKALEEKAKEAKLDIHDMPLNSLGDYLKYNAEARKLNKRLGMCRYPIKQCPEELHPKERIVFGRNDQPSNPLTVYLSNELIDYKRKLIPGQTYDIPRCVVEYLSKKGTPVWKWYETGNGAKETRISHKEPRFALRTVYAD